MITLHIIVGDADAASAWYQNVFGAIERSRIVLPDGKLIHVEIDLDGSSMMLADEFPDHGACHRRQPATPLRCSTSNARMSTTRGSAQSPVVPLLYGHSLTCSGENAKGRSPTPSDIGGD